MFGIATTFRDDISRRHFAPTFRADDPRHDADLVDRPARICVHRRCAFRSREAVKLEAFAGAKFLPFNGCLHYSERIRAQMTTRRHAWQRRLFRTFICPSHLWHIILDDPRSPPPGLCYPRPVLLFRSALEPAALLASCPSSSRLRKAIE